MLINKRTKTKKILPYLDEKQVEDIINQIPEVALPTPILELSIGEFGALLDDEETYIKNLLNEKYLFDALGKLKSFKRQMEELTNFLKLYEVKQTKEEKQAAVGVVFPDFAARMLLTVTKFFGLKSFDEAEKVKLSNYLLILQDEVSSMQYQRNYQNIINQQMKQKK